MAIFKTVVETNRVIAVSGRTWFGICFRWSLYFCSLYYSFWLVNLSHSMAFISKVAQTPNVDFDTPHQNLTRISIITLAMLSTKPSFDMLLYNLLLTFSVLCFLSYNLASESNYLLLIPFSILIFKDFHWNLQSYLAQQGPWIVIHTSALRPTVSCTLTNIPYRETVSTKHHSRQEEDFFQWLCPLASSCSGDRFPCSTESLSSLLHTVRTLQHRGDATNPFSRPGSRNLVRAAGQISNKILLWVLGCINGWMGV